MSYLIALGILAVIALLSVVTLAAYRIYKRLKEIEENLIQEVSQTKEAFLEVVNGIMPTATDIPTGRKEVTPLSEEKY